MIVTYELTGFILWSVFVFFAGVASVVLVTGRHELFDHWKHIHPIQVLKHDIQELQGK